MTATIEIEVEVDYLFERGEKAQTHGRMEDCNPDAPDTAKIISVKLGEVEILTGLTYEQIRKLSEEAVIFENEPREF